MAKSKITPPRRAVEAIRALVTQLGFLPESNKESVYLKKYAGNYVLRVDFERELFDYGTKITLGSVSPQNFTRPENFVVFECVDRLLVKGYKPERISLERLFPLGHKDKGWLDVSVADDNGRTFLMIECKTWGTEYENAIKKMGRTGGQLLSYYQQDKSTQFLCLYASRLLNNAIEYATSIVKTDPDLLDTTSVAEAYSRWNKNFRDNGIFESWVTPYNVVSKALRKPNEGEPGGLKPLTRDDSGIIFNQFAEILRHHVVSDKPNAFNKLITLLLCKIVDEERQEGEEYHFQWFENDTDTELQKRLSDLYKRGMRDYLSKEVTDYSDNDIDNKFHSLGEAERTEIKIMMTALRLEKNNEFAFKEVFNKASFADNSRVLREVVELLQPYQVRYSQKQQFLGDFFELLLTTSIKQEAGQFFTPVPIARFIISSIPFRKVISDKIAQNENDYLPFVIDYAAGSGHFITEAMDEIHNIIVEMKGNASYKKSIKNEVTAWATLQPFTWAYKYVYGIERDYRLVKTAKVSCFLNGDGLARVLNADGLANFQTSDELADRLKVISKDDPKENRQFDILVANPPYSVAAFKNNLVDGEQSFDLYPRLTDTSREIECLFIERTKQLLRDGGYAGIIFPPAILDSGGIYQDTREYLLKYFRIVGIVKLGSKTFMATKVDTIVLFLERRNNAEWRKITHTVEQFFTNQRDVSSNGIENAFSKYVDHVFENIELEDYITLVQQQPNEVIQQHDLFVNYQKWFEELTEVKKLKEKPAFIMKSDTEQRLDLDRLFYAKVLVIEREKLLYFLLTYAQKVVYVDVNPSNDTEKEELFLGYAFSNRRGKEGIKPTGNAKTILEATHLYDETYTNEKKVNSYIYNAFLHQYPDEIDAELKDNLQIRNLVEMFSFDSVEFDKEMSLNHEIVNFEDVWGRTDLIPLSDIADIKKGSTITKPQTRTGDIPVVAGGKSPAYYHDTPNRKGNIVTVSSSGASAGFVNFYALDIWASDCITVQAKDEDNYSTKLIYALLKHLQDKITLNQRGRAQPHVYDYQLKKIKMPILTKTEKAKLIEEFEADTTKKKKRELEAMEEGRGISSVFKPSNEVGSISQVS